MFKNRIKNFILCWKYPFLAPRNVWTGKRCLYYYAYTLLDLIPEGWYKAFGVQLCEDLKKVWLTLPKAERKLFMITDIKEKYNQLRIYTNFTTDEIEEVINYYADLSTSFCVRCGKPARWESEGYIMSFCDDCKKYLEDGYKEGSIAHSYTFKKLEKHNEKIF